ncbi:unnamed protein product (mitochondrion) [Arabidopsis thaliana]|uniref:Putative cytochrome c biosynthesis ccmC-like mitochondrial protein n=1 Tax=Arabidopsis thaliana TaxID=3702 RepID=A0A7G2FQG9_ARATH|nr:unnamed protein product [Arabidopsis thaliana]
MDLLYSMTKPESPRSELFHKGLILSDRAELSCRRSLFLSTPRWHLDFPRSSANRSISSFGRPGQPTYTELMPCPPNHERKHPIFQDFLHRALKSFLRRSRLTFSGNGMTRAKERDQGNNYAHQVITEGEGTVNENLFPFWLPNVLIKELILTFAPVSQKAKAYQFVEATSLGYLWMDDLSRAISQFYPVVSGGLGGGNTPMPPTNPSEGGLLEGYYAHENEHSHDQQRGSPFWSKEYKESGSKRLFLNLEVEDQNTDTIGEQVKAESDKCEKIKAKIIAKTHELLVSEGYHIPDEGDIERAINVVMTEHEMIDIDRRLDFFAMIFPVVHIGAIAVSFLFVVMMFHIQIAEIHEEVLRYLPTRSYAQILIGSWLFLTAMAIHLSLGVAPLDLQQGGNSRILYVHVPAARMSIIVYIATAINTFLFLLTKHPLYLRSSGTGIEMGAFFTLFTLVTGGFRGRPMWGTFWVWDARLTSVFISFLIYLGALRFQKLPVEPASISIRAGPIDIPIIKSSVNWWNTSHQPGSISRSGTSIHVPMPIPILSNFANFPFSTRILFVLETRLPIPSFLESPITEEIEAREGIPKPIQSQLTESKEIARPYSLWGISLAQHSFKTSTRSTGKKRSKGSTSQDGKKQESLESRNDLAVDQAPLFLWLCPSEVKLGNEADRSQSKKGSPIGSGIAYLSFLLQYALGKGKGGGQVDLILRAVSMKKRARSLARSANDSFESIQIPNDNIVTRGIGGYELNYACNPLTWDTSLFSWAKLTLSGAIAYMEPAGRAFLNSKSLKLQTSSNPDPSSADLSLPLS